MFFADIKSDIKVVNIWISARQYLDFSLGTQEANIANSHIRFDISTKPLTLIGHYIPKFFRTFSASIERFFQFKRLENLTTSKQTIRWKREDQILQEATTRMKY